MRRWISLICILCLVLLGISLPGLRNALPFQAQPLVEKKYGSWSGVLRLWVFEGWPVGIGSVAGWLNRCIDLFEKQHPGVYIQPEYVESTAITSLRESGIVPPDLMMFPPGLLPSPECLMPLPNDYPLRVPLLRGGSRDGVLFAAPVLAGGYLWATNAALVDDGPQSSVPSISAPPDEPWRHWGAALLSLCADGLTESNGSKSDAPRSGELDLGLEGQAEAAASASTGDAPDRLSSGITFADDAWRGFINGDVAAMPVTQREIARLRQLSDQGRGVDWRLSRPGAAFTDQLLFAAVVDPEVFPHEEEMPPRDLCLAFIKLLLGEKAQSMLHSIGAFSVTDALSGFSPGDDCAILEQSLREPTLAIPNCFDASWREEATPIVREFADNTAASRRLWRRLAARLLQ